VPREDDKTINVVAKEVELLNAKKTNQVEAVLQYVSDNKNCRSLQLVSYFGEANTEPCGICSVCAKTENVLGRKEVQLIARNILRLLQKDMLNSRQIFEALNYTEEEVMKVLKLLLDAERICIDNKNKFSLK
jgi:ATP-dependent DNA helicase RecQ